MKLYHGVCALESICQRAIKCYKRSDRDLCVPDVSLEGGGILVVPVTTVPSESQLWPILLARVGLVIVLWFQCGFGEPGGTVYDIYSTTQ